MRPRPGRARRDGQGAPYPQHGQLSQQAAVAEPLQPDGRSSGATFRPGKADRAITRYHPVLSVLAATIRGVVGDQETVTTAAAVTAGGDLVPRAGAEPPGPGAIAAELLARTRAELPVLAGLGEREELLAAAWLASLRAPRTRRAYAA